MLSGYHCFDIWNNRCRNFGWVNSVAEREVRQAHPRIQFTEQRYRDPASHFRPRTIRRCCARFPGQCAFRPVGLNIRKNQCHGTLAFSFLGQNSLFTALLSKFESTIMFSMHHFNKNMRTLTHWIRPDIQAKSQKVVFPKVPSHFE